MSRWTFTSESVTEGHPDKMADQISDAILDAMLEQDPASRVACETMVTTGLVVVAGEITTSGFVDIPAVVRETINEIGYDRDSLDFNGSTCGVMVSLDEQSPDIAQGVNDSEEVRSGQAGEDDALDQCGEVTGKRLRRASHLSLPADGKRHLGPQTARAELSVVRRGTQPARSPQQPDAHFYE